MVRNIGCSWLRGLLAAAVGLLLVPAALADIAGFKNGLGWSINGQELGAGAGMMPTITADTVQITTDVSDEHNTVFYLSPQVVTTDIVGGTTGKWMASFVYQCGGTMMADGAAFVIQNNNALNALTNGTMSAMSVGTQNGGSGLGYQGIDNSIAVAFDVYSASNPLHVGTGHMGQTDLVFSSTTLGSVSNPGGTYANDPTVTGTPPFTLTGPDPIQVTLTYDQSTTTLTQDLTDMTTGATASYTYTVDFALVVGADARNLQTPFPGTAFVGFSGGTGGATSIQTFSNFTFIENP